LAGLKKIIAGDFSGSSVTHQGSFVIEFLVSDAFSGYLRQLLR
jgi:hypothetical protein